MSLMQLNKSRLNTKLLPSSKMFQSCFAFSLQHHSLGWSAGQENPAVWRDVPSRRVWPDWVHQCRFGQSTMLVALWMLKQCFFFTVCSTPCTDDSSKGLCLHCYGSQTRRQHSLKQARSRVVQSQPETRKGTWALIAFIPTFILDLWLSGDCG